MDKLEEYNLLRTGVWVTFQVPSNSVADPDPMDPYVFGPPGTVSKSVPFYHQAKIVRKNLLSDFFMTLI